MNNIKKLRVFRGIKQEELALKIGICVVYLRKMENNKMYVKPSLRNEIAWALDFSVEQIFPKGCE